MPGRSGACRSNGFSSPPRWYILWVEVTRTNQVVSPQPGRNRSATTSAAPLAPAWAAEWAFGRERRLSHPCGVSSSADFSLVTVKLPGADAADGPGLETLTTNAYRMLFHALADGPHPHAVRVWNFLPRILGDSGEGLDRYMRFNAGRYRAFSECLGRVETFDRSVPAASAVGYEGSELVICALAAAAPGVAVANPRQVSPHRYSRRFGPLPPCFARATRIDAAAGKRFLLIGGTASIRGEESVHVGDLSAQLAETAENLSVLIQSATGAASSANALRLLDRLRVYYVRPSDLPVIRRAVEAWFPNQQHIAWMRADLCRGDLLVEIEGRAQL